MRYFIHSKHFEDIFARKQYIEEVTKLYFIQQHNLGNFIVLQSFPFTSEQDICLVYGHNYEVANFLQKQIIEITEKKIFIISCERKYRSAYLVKGKKIYISPQQEEYVKLRDGHAYGFDFDISDVELNLYNSRLNTIWGKLTNSFIKLN